MDLIHYHNKECLVFHHKENKAILGIKQLNLLLIPYNLLIKRYDSKKIDQLLEKSDVIKPLILLIKVTIFIFQLY